MNLEFKKKGDEKPWGKKMQFWDEFHGICCHLWKSAKPLHVNNKNLHLYILCVVKLVKNCGVFWLSKDVSAIVRLCEAMLIRWADSGAHSSCLLSRSGHVCFATSSSGCTICSYCWLFGLRDLFTISQPNQCAGRVQVFGIPVVCGWRSKTQFITLDWIELDAKLSLPCLLSLWWSWGQTGHMTFPCLASVVENCHVMLFVEWSDQENRNTVCRLFAPSP